MHASAQAAAALVGYTELDWACSKRLRYTQRNKPHRGEQTATNAQAQPAVYHMLDVLSN